MGVFRSPGVDGGWLLAALVLAGSTACDSWVVIGERADVGAFPLPWVGTVEPGDFSEWLDHPEGFRVELQGGSLRPTTEQAHDGQWSAEVSIVADGTISQALLAFALRTAPSAEPRLSAWYFLPEKPETDHLVIMKLSTLEGTDTNDFFDIDLGRDSTGRVQIFAWGHAGVGEVGSRVAVPIATWFRVEASFRSDPTNGRVQVAIDGTSFYDSGPMNTGTGEGLGWFVGGAAQWVDPVPYVFYVDQAEIR